MGRRVIPTVSYGEKFYWEILTESRKGVLPMDQLTQFRYKSNLTRLRPETIGDLHFL